MTGLKAEIAPAVRRGEKIRLRAELLAAGPVRGRRLSKWKSAIRRGGVTLLPATTL
ncbi:MAG: hypothetical protein L6W00_08020 [Lentisphaeria bacterium]|nr:MAG: hypothetical protein L6W00_08020 [Lentisphaeria bacterium]